MRDERSCSGDMYIGEPSTSVVCVSAPSVGSPAPVIFEMPKSSTLMMRRLSDRFARKRFDGLRSRWTMPSACASAMASHASST